MVVGGFLRRNSNLFSAVWVTIQTFWNEFVVMRDVEITKETVELYKILKFEGVVSSGGQAKAVIDDGQVLVNGEVETRRRKKIVSGDVVEFMDQKLNIVFHAAGSK